MTLTTHWKRRHDAKLETLRNCMWLTYTDWLTDPPRRKPERLTVRLCTFTHELQSVHDDWHNFLRMVHRLELSVKLPTSTKVCSWCKHIAETYRQLGIKAYYDDSRMPPPIIGASR